ncbi:TrmO family methyltransferase [Candidatus Bathyarchaeota archaeon]|nr:TrmO family methyltransferase [Candidatus Bathyarchaeota archaeon]
MEGHGAKLFVLGLDCFDGTPILDIKPYRDDYRTDQYELADWYRELRKKTGKDLRARYAQALNIRFTFPSL